MPKSGKIGGVLKSCWRQRGARFFTLALEVDATKERKSPEKDPSQVPIPKNRLAISLGEEANRGLPFRGEPRYANRNDGGQPHE